MATGSKIPVTAGTFARDAAAYQTLPAGQSTYSANERRTTAVLTSSGSSGTLIAADAKAGGGTVALEVWCSNSRYLFGFDRTNRKVYKSADGLTNWTLCSDTVLNSQYVLFSNSLGYIFRLDNSLAVWYSDDDCATWKAVNNVDTVSQLVLGATAQWYPWSFYQASNGTIIMGTYGTNSGPGQLWRSTDNGLTFKNVLALDAGLITHFHSVCKHEATGTWVANTGDGGPPRTFTANTTTGLVTASSTATTTGMRCYLTTTGALPTGFATTTTYYIRRNDDNSFYLHPSYADAVGGTNTIIPSDTGTGTHSCWSGRVYTFVSTDDGVNWDYHRKVSNTGKQNAEGQVTRYLDVGHPTRLLICSDVDGMLGWVDVTTWQSGPYLTSWDPSVGDRYALLGFIADGYVYAAQYNSSYSGATEPTISIASVGDLTKWTHYDRVITPSGSPLVGATAYAGYKGGVHHLCLQRNDKSWIHYTIAPVRTATKSGLLIHPASTNLCTADMSQCDSLSGFSGTSGWDSYSASGGVIHLTKTEDIDYSQIYFTVSTTVGKKYVASVWAKGVMSRARIYFNGQSAEQARWSGVDATNYTRLVSRPFTATGVSSTVYICGYANFAQSPMIDMTIDNIQVQEVPVTEWHPGPSASTLETWSTTVSLSSAWTHVFSAELLPSYSTLSSDTSPLRFIATWKLNATNYVCLYYDPADYKFKLRSTDSGVGGTPVATAAVWYARNQLAKFAIRYNAGSMIASVCLGGVTYHTAALARSAGNDLAGASRTWQTGDGNSSGVYPMILVDDAYMYDGSLTNEEVVELFGSVNTGAKCSMMLGV